MAGFAGAAGAADGAALAGAAAAGAAAGASLVAFVFLSSEAVSSSEAAALRVFGAIVDVVSWEVLRLSRRGISDELKPHRDPGSTKWREFSCSSMCQAPKIFLASDVDATVERVAAGSHALHGLSLIHI